MKNWLICFLLCTTIIYAAGFCPKDRIEKAKAGDYIVTEANKMITVLSVHSISPSTVILQEISAPLEN